MNRSWNTYVKKGAAIQEIRASKNILGLLSQPLALNYFSQFSIAIDSSPGAPFPQPLAQRELVFQ